MVLCANFPHEATYHWCELPAGRSWRRLPPWAPPQPSRKTRRYRAASARSAAAFSGRRRGLRRPLTAQMSSLWTRRPLCHRISKRAPLIVEVAEDPGAFEQDALSPRRKRMRLKKSDWTARVLVGGLKLRQRNTGIASQIAKETAAASAAPSPRPTTTTRGA